MTNAGWSADHVGGDVELVELEYDQVETDPSTAVIDAISDVEGVDPIELSLAGDSRLYDAVDPDALDRLVSEGEAGELEVTFAFERYTVWVDCETVVVAHTDRTDPPR